MDFFALARALFDESPIYWTGVIVWLVGFASYLPIACGLGTRVLATAGLGLSALGLAVTLLAAVALDARYDAPPFDRPTFDWAFWFRASTQIWLLWIIGGALAAASWLGWFTARVGWLGIAAAMVGLVAAWFSDRASQQVIIEIGAGFVAALMALLALRNDLLPSIRHAA